MTAREIRNKAELLHERSAFARYDQSDWLAEIAAQLAELNENLKAANLFAQEQVKKMASSLAEIEKM